MLSNLNNEISLVRGHLAVGSQGCAEDPITLSDYEIGAILSLTPTNPALDIPHYLVEIQDQQPLQRDSINECLAFIDKQKELGNRILVHCEMGISRAPIICICYLYEREAISLEEAFYQISIQHPTASPHPILITSIKNYYKGNNWGLFTRIRSSLTENH